MIVIWQDQAKRIKPLLIDSISHSLDRIKWPKVLCTGKEIFVVI